MKLQIKTKFPLQTLARLRTLFYGLEIKFLQTDGSNAFYSLHSSGGVSLDMLNTIAEELGHSNIIVY